MWSGVFLQTGIWLQKGLRLFSRAPSLFVCHDNFSYEVTKQASASEIGGRSYFMLKAPEIKMFFF